MNITNLQRTTIKAAAIAVCLCATAPMAFAQAALKVGSKEIQVHGAIQQGFVFSDGNNFLTMDTTDGSGAMTDGAFNVASQLTPKLRIGAQMYTRNIGELGNGQLQIDWGFADYRFAKAFGIRVGKVKTPLGLFNDTQDLEFLHTWALLPQGVYPLDLRSITIAHVGGDVYGSVSLKKAGAVSYTVYGGMMQDDTNGGYRYGVEDQGLVFTDDIKLRGVGFDTRWATPVNGLSVGYSYLESGLDANLRMPVPPQPLNLKVDVDHWRRQAVFGDYQNGRVRLNGEWRRENYMIMVTPALGPTNETTPVAWFGSGAYRVNDWLEVGSYHSHFLSNFSQSSQTAATATDASHHIYDTAVTGRFDLNRFWNVKVEGHLIDGYGDTTVNPRGFYMRSNRAGLEPNTKMLVVRTGVNF